MGAILGRWLAALVVQVVGFAAVLVLVAWLVVGHLAALVGIF
jgi:hypothetical protein